MISNRTRDIMRTINGHPTSVAAEGAKNHGYHQGENYSAFKADSFFVEDRRAVGRRSRRRRRTKKKKKLAVDNN